jgi:hypothetical protein
MTIAEDRIPVTRQEFAHWSEIHEFVDMMTVNSQNIDLLSCAIQSFYMRAIDQVKAIVCRRSVHYDALIARLQYLEDRYRSPPKTDSDLDRDAEILTQLLGEDMTHTVVFDFGPTAQTATLQIAGFFSVNCVLPTSDLPPSPNITNLDQEINGLKAVNVRYLSAGLTWKQKYERSQSLLDRMLQDNAAELLSLSRLNAS